MCLLIDWAAEKRGFCFAHEKDFFFGMECDIMKKNGSGGTVMKGALLQAHRGVSTDCPENTMSAFRAAVRQGYDTIELDPKFTRDGACVILHDRTVDRTGRRMDGGPLPAVTAIGDMTLAQAREWEYGGGFAPAWQRPAPQARARWRVPEKPRPPEAVHRW